eukprot:CAMPEP_0177694758 /NCGR_PEP_ID=MMETSP0484_2-20121128/3101_1 /TAXON_ID=354590 /ORGANISM="Rhodomonas lens, Strain RHODO" /LENGTH=48 /DNA_ID= /DNA_START= /DNA_END= /DNA_ORIENTATION=
MWTMVCLCASVWVSVSWPEKEPRGSISLRPEVYALGRGGVLLAGAEAA